MNKIKVLDRHVAQLIAAGEVVERPSSVVKELLENSIDAGATHITVEIKNGGISYIRVTDNGCGISYEDTKKAFLRHATSKVFNEQDLEGIETLGFRGEALASIASVARVEMLTCTKEEMAGTRYVIHGGQPVLAEEAGCPQGTTIVVRDLFYNTPARLKFLKKDFTEANYIAGVVDKIALSHPEISIGFIRDGKLSLKTGGSGSLINCIFEVLGKEFSQGLTEVDYSFEGVRVSGYICKPDSVRPNRNMQYFFVNGRHVKSSTCTAALEQGYKGSIMAGRFPSCVLFIKVQPDLIDCNIHPAKIEVRFKNERDVFSAIYHAVKSALMGDTSKPEIKLSEREQQVSEQTVIEQDKLWDNSDNSQTDQIRQDFKADHDKVEIEPEKKPKKRAFLDDYILYDTNTGSNTLFGFDRKYINIDINPDDDRAQHQDDIASKEPAAKEQEVTIERETTKEQEVKIIGEVFDTYILVQREHELIIIDKHAAHERLIYEKLRNEKRDNQAQMLISPVTVTLEKGEYDALVSNIELLGQAGFEVEDFGAGTVLVRAAPMMLEHQDIGVTLSEIAGKLITGAVNVTTDRLEWIYHSIACRAAIKAGDKSSPAELMQLYKDLANNPKLRHCPHGRTIVRVLTKSELEKQFGRT